MHLLGLCDSPAPMAPTTTNIGFASFAPRIGSGMVIEGQSSNDSITLYLGNGECGGFSNSTGAQYTSWRCEEPSSGVGGWGAVEATPQSSSGSSTIPGPTTTGNKTGGNNKETESSTNLPDPTKLKLPQGWWDKHGAWETWKEVPNRNPDYRRFVPTVRTPGQSPPGITLNLPDGYVTVDDGWRNRSHWNPATGERLSVPGTRSPVLFPGLPPYLPPYNVRKPVHISGNGADLWRVSISNSGRRLGRGTASCALR